MTIHNRSIKEAAAQLSKTFGSDTVEVLYCTVNSVDVDKCTCSCTPISGKATTGLENVLLKSEANDGFMLVPSIDSTVVVGISDLTKIPFVIMFEDIDQVLVKIKETTVDISDGLTEFNGGENGGLVNVLDVVDRLNKVENKINGMITTFNAHVHTIPTGVSGAPVIPISGTLTPTVRQDIEDTKITH